VVVGGDSSSVACATVAIVSPLEMAKSMAAHAKAIRIDRCQRTWRWWARHVGSGVDCPLMHRERPTSKVGEVLT
jgi:hypothetical protein